MLHTILWSHIPSVTIVWGTSNIPQTDIGEYLGFYLMCWNLHVNSTHDLLPLFFPHFLLEAVHAKGSMFGPSTRNARLLEFQDVGSSPEVPGAITSNWPDRDEGLGTLGPTPKNYNSTL